jgi:glucose dehydrogenase
MSRTAAARSAPRRFRRRRSFSTTPPFNRIIALDPRTGRERWNYNPNVDISSSGRRQYVAIAAGGHGALGGFGDSVVAFTLP